MRSNLVIIPNSTKLIPGILAIRILGSIDIFTNGASIIQNEFKGYSLQQAMRRATKQNKKNIETKNGRFSALAPPLFWGPWTIIWSQFGVSGPNKDNHVSYIDISFDTISLAPSTFDVEIKGGDRFISTVGPGSQLVTVTGNVATEIAIRFKSHSTPLNIDMRVI